MRKYLVGCRGRFGSPGPCRKPKILTPERASAFVFRDWLWLLAGSEQPSCIHQTRFAEIRSDQLEAGHGKASTLERDRDRKGGITGVVHRHGVLQTKHARFKECRSPQERLG